MSLDDLVAVLGKDARQARPGNQNAKKHGHVTRCPTTGRKVKSSTYVTWEHMKQRCHNPRADFFPHYGGRGIVVCEAWRRSFAAFLADMGERPPGKTLDRVDVNGNYEPGNCRWATNAEQSLNRRNAKRNKAKSAQKKATARRRFDDATE